MISSKVPDEEKVMAALRPFNIAPGDYGIPKPASMADMQSAAYKEKLQKGPVVFMTVLPPQASFMGSALIQWFLYSVVISLFAAYITGRALGSGANYLSVFRFAGTTAFAAYALALPQFAIWYRRSWKTTLLSMFDCLIYACLTAGTFGWLWPR